MFCSINLSVIVSYICSVINQLKICKMENLTIKRETEKAVLIAANLVCETTDQSVSSDFWCPKSLINNNIIADWFLGKKREELSSYHSYSGYLTLELI